MAFFELVEILNGMYIILNYVSILLAGALYINFAKEEKFLLNF